MLNDENDNIYLAKIMNYEDINLKLDTKNYDKFFFSNTKQLTLTQKKV